jgi:hypothetical protein
MLFRRADALALDDALYLPARLGGTTRTDKKFLGAS